MQIANICLHYFPLISHQSKFSEKIKVYAVKTVPFELNQCDHSETLRKSIVENYVDSLNDYYFGFLRKIIKGFDLPEEADDLMHIVHAAGSRYSKMKPLQEGMKEEVTQQSMCRKPDAVTGIMLDTKHVSVIHKRPAVCKEQKLEPFKISNEVKGNNIV